MSKYIIECYECGDKCATIPQREPLHDSAYTDGIIDITGASYPPTSKTYKCVNPECWVTKIEVSWS